MYLAGCCGYFRFKKMTDLCKMRLCGYSISCSNIRSGWPKIKRRTKRRSKKRNETGKRNKPGGRRGNREVTAAAAAVVVMRVLPRMRKRGRKGRSRRYVFLHIYVKFLRISPDSCIFLNGSTTTIFLCYVTVVYLSAIVALG